MITWITAQLIRAIEKWTILILLLITFFAISSVIDNDFNQAYGELSDAIQRINLKISLTLG